MFNHIILFSENDKNLIKNNYIGENSKVAHLYPSRTQKLSTLALTIVLTSENRTLPTPFYNLLKKCFDIFLFI